MFLGSVPLTSIIYAAQDNTAPDVAMQTSVLNMLTESGRPAVVTRTGDQSYDPATGTMTAGVGSVWAVQALQMDYSNREIDGSVVQRGDAKFLVPGVSKAPQVNDIMTFAGIAWRVINTTAVAPQGYPILYTVQGRR